MKKYNNFVNQLNESAPRIPNSEDYWIKKGKIGKEAMIYFHDDLDGIYSATVMKNYLEGKGFTIHGYGIVNYQEGWNTTKLNPKYINIALDYADNVDGIDVYMDHHGSFDLEEVRDREKNRGSVKTETTSAYEGICDQLGLPIDATIQNVIDMVDSAKYDDYNIEQEVLLDFDPKKFKSKLEFAAAFNQMLKRSDHKTFIEVVANSKDKAPSIYNIYRLFRLLYPANNMNLWAVKKGAKNAGFGTDIDAYVKHLKLNDKELLKSFQKDFIDDAKSRLDTMQDRTRGKSRYGSPKEKRTIQSQQDFMNLFQTPKGIKMEGYQILGNMVFVPSGTWANALRARAIVEKDMEKITTKLDAEYGKSNGLIPTIDYIIDENSDLYSDLETRIGQTLELIGDLSYTGNDAHIKIMEEITKEDKKEGITGIIDKYDDKLIFRAKQPIFWVLLQYGNTFQVASYHKLENYDTNYLPKLKDGTVVGNLGKYCEVLLKNFENHFGLDPKIIDGVTTVAGGHKGIGSISNVAGRASKFMVGSRFLDLIKNKMIQDLSGIPWTNIKMPWGDESEERHFTNGGNSKDTEYNKKTIFGDNIRNAQDVHKER